MVPPAAEPTTDADGPRARGGDRRGDPTRRISWFSLLGGRRRVLRRGGEREGSFVDIYSPRLLLLLMWIALMNALDSFFTLVHLQAGGVELNPVAQFLLDGGRRPFVLWKSTLIGAALLILCVHKNFALARIGIWTAASVYTLLLAYHLSLFGVA